MTVQPPESARYAVYWAPEAQAPLWRAGCEWLGRDPAMDTAAAAPPQPWLSEPWRYGFHATLKAPMRLAPGCQPSDLLAEVARLAGSHRRFAMPSLHVDWLDGFLALVCAHALAEHHPLQRLANDCVTGLDRFRAEPSPDELARRTAAPLDELGHDLLLRWGYPHVLQRWRFHMTLSNSFADTGGPAAQALLQVARQRFAPLLARPLEAGSLCVFVQEKPGSVFALRHRFALAD